jgi:NAD-dependent deacetylase
MATYDMFQRHPEAVWGWYLYRRGICLAADPNAAHMALVELEQALADRFVLLTQNVDGLHLRAGNSVERTLQVHGNLHCMRCARECGRGPVPVPVSLGARPAGEPLRHEEQSPLTCEHCGGWMRPHVLWFDESYDEERYRCQSALRAAAQAAMLVVIGTSGATTLPMAAAEIAARSGAALVNIDLGANPFAHLARATGGVHVAGEAATHVPAIVRTCIAAFAAGKP